MDSPDSQKEADANQQIVVLKRQIAILTRSLYIVTCIAVAIAAALGYLAANDNVVIVSQSPFVRQADGTYQVRKGDIICEGECPPPENRVAGVNIYMKTGGIVFGNLTFTRVGTTDDATVIYDNTVFFRLRNGSTIVGDVDVQRVQSGNVYLSGMTPTNKDPTDFADVTSTFGLLAADGSVVYVDKVKEKLNSYGRSGFRLRTDQVKYTMFPTPEPQIIINNPSLSFIRSNVASSVITEDSEYTLAAYPCVEGPFRDASDRLTIVSNAAPSTCFSSIEGRNSKTPISLASTTTCIPVSSISDVVTGLQSVLTYPDICFSATACSSATSTISARQRMTNLTLSPTVQTIPVGCTTVGSVQFLVFCSRVAI